MPDDNLRVFVHQRGIAPTGPGHKFLGGGTTILRRKLRRADNAPYHFENHPENRYNRPQIVKEVHSRMDAHRHDGFRQIIHTAAYDKAPWVIEWIRVDPPVAAAVTWAEQFVGKSSYLLGGSGPPGPSDCSQLTQNACREVLGINIPDTAVEQGNDPSQFHYFTDFSELVSGDFCFFKYSNRVGSSPNDYDHVEFYKGNHVNVGSRPSTNGVNYYHWVYEDHPDSSFSKFGRLIG